jgi:NADPH:quinone reductase-like Zn-dependent oxidoreductase
METTGKDVTRFEPDGEVSGIGTGTYAQHAPAAENKLTPKPTNLTLNQTTVIAISGLTAPQGLRNHGNIQPGQRMLITDASDGVDIYAVQLAKASGAHVTAICSTT